MALVPTQIRCFDAVVRSGSFRAAAELLHLSQPAVSMNVAKLERDLGVQLLRRTGRGSELTAAGTEMLPHLRGMLRAEEAAEQHAAVLQGRRVGLVRVAAVNSAVIALLPKVVQFMADEQPDLDVEVVELNSAEVNAGVLDGTYDVGVSAQPIIGPHDLDIETIADSGELLVVAHPDHPVFEAPSLTRAVVAREPFVVLREGYTLRQLVLRYLEPHHARIVGEALNHDTVRRLVRAKLGITLMPRVTFEATGDDTDLSGRPVDDNAERTQLRLIRREDAAPASGIVAGAIRYEARARFPHLQVKRWKVRTPRGQD